MTLTAKRLMTLMLGPVLMLLSTSLWAAEHALNPINMPEGISAVSREVYDLHMLGLWFCIWLAIPVFAAMLWTIIFHRKSLGHKAATWHESLTVEILWTVIPFLMLGFLVGPAYKTLIKVYDTKNADLDIMITGYQWKWKYEYLGQDVSFFSNLATPQDEIRGKAEKSDNYLLEVDEAVYLPVNKKVRFLVTGNDVIHAWYVPALAVKKDGIPGFVNEAWARPEKTGVYRGQCAELCGKDHGFMPIVIKVVEEQEYNEWLGKKKAEAAEIKELMKLTLTRDELIQRGEGVYQTRCAACHGPAGEGGVGTALKGSKMATGPIMAHLDIVVHGSKKNALMQAFGNQLNDLDTAAVVTYERNSWGNNMGDSLQAADVYKFKKQ